MKQPLLSEISRRNKLRLLSNHLKPGMEILEIGSNAGWFTEQLRAKGYSVTTLDIVPPADIVGDIQNWGELGVAPASFDVCVALEVIEHVDCMEALKAICKPGGLIMLSSPHPHYDWVMKILEGLRLNQKRTSPHCNLTDFAEINLPALVKKRPAYIHQIAVFQNAH
ncbi:MAG: class I SAM-dependent methyltransferase [Acidiferrobacterales bacterium]|nr:class I SAM-dependent methyltransferase [Acidiferrobacterales bacterium]